VKYATGIAFYAGWATGAVEALFHHQSQVVTETQEKAAPPPAPSARLDLFPTNEALDAGFTVAF
jgi:hypothetical protein